MCILFDKNKPSFILEQTSSLGAELIVYFLQKWNIEYFQTLPRDSALCAPK